MRMHYRLPAPSLAGSEASASTALRSAPVQVILYDGDQPTAVEGSAKTYADGLTVIELPETPSPAPGTPVQIIVYSPGGTPTVIEGTVYDSGDPHVIGIEPTVAPR